MGQNIGVQILSLGGTSRALNINAPTVVKATPGTIFRIVCQVAPSAGNLIVNDNNALGGTNTIANQLLSVLFGALLVAGQVITLEAACLTGITISSVGTGGVYAVTFS